MNIKAFREITTPQNQFMAMKVAMVVGSLLFLINHGQAVMNGKMTRSRWISGLMTYCVPYMVSLHGQHQGKKKLRKLEN